MDIRVVCSLVVIAALIVMWMTEMLISRSDTFRVHIGHFFGAAFILILAVGDHVPSVLYQAFAFASVLAAFRTSWVLFKSRSRRTQL